MTGELEITILGSGSSGGVPRGNGDWGACDPTDARNRRRRCSLLVRRRGAPGQGDTTLVVDTSPDLREQMLAAEVRKIDAVLYTHDHADQAHGIDDLRTFAATARRRIPCWMDPATARTLTTRFDYIFRGMNGYPAICDALELPSHGTPFAVEGDGGPITVETFDQAHGPIRSVGYRFGGVAYSSDVSDLDDAVLDSLQGLDLWILDALRWSKHPTHAHVGQALEWIARVRPRRAVLTNLHIDLDYAALAAQLPEGVEPAYDGWTTTTQA
ncbi:MAG TPA: MBL fold metallo-hydrolase [Caulobacteraceae bacterium]|jgi:phosphoribosyl 1,2-cyclic phosphate phosphodiesterase